MWEDAYIDGEDFDTEVHGVCDTCGAFYDLAERSVTGTKYVRCGDCGNCSECCPPEHPRDCFDDDCGD